MFLALFVRSRSRLCVALEMWDLHVAAATQAAWAALQRDGPAPGLDHFGRAGRTGVLDPGGPDPGSAEPGDVVDGSRRHRHGAASLRSSGTRRAPPRPPSRRTMTRAALSAASAGSVTAVRRSRPAVRQCPGVVADGDVEAALTRRWAGHGGPMDPSPRHRYTQTGMGSSIGLISSARHSVTPFDTGWHHISGRRGLAAAQPGGAPLACPAPMHTKPAAAATAAASSGSTDCCAAERAAAADVPVASR
jgi:hypothetical protein